MIRHGLIFSILALSFSAFSAQTLESCKTAGLDYGSQTRMPSSVSKDCYPILLNQKNNINYDESTDYLIKAVGVNNMLFVQVHTVDEDDNEVLVSEHITSGNQSKLSNIQAIDFNEDDARIYVLNESSGEKQVLSFGYDDDGNNAPMRKLITPELSQASNIKVDNVNSEIYAVSKSGSWLKVFNKLADPDGRREENSVTVKRSLTGASTHLDNPIDVSVSVNEIFVLDKDRILIFDRSASGSSSPKREIAGASTQMSNAEKIEYDAESKQITVTNSDGQELNYNANSNGNTAPVQ